MKTINVEIPEGKEAKWVNGVLTLVDEAPQNIMERVKTFEDALNELGDSHPFVKQYEQWSNVSTANDEGSVEDIDAYLKLRIITCALNEGWEPDFWNESEYKYWGWMYTLTEDEYNRLDEDEKKERTCLCVGRSYYNAGAHGGPVYAYSSFGSSFSYAYYGSRLAFKSRELAVYAVNQFKEIFAKYLF